MQGVQLQVNGIARVIPTEVTTVDGSHQLWRVFKYCLAELLLVVVVVGFLKWVCSARAYYCS